MDLRQMVFALSAASGPTGYESSAVAVAQELLRPLVDETSIDAVGNLIGMRSCGKVGAKRVLLDAHLDEVSLTVTGAERGFLTFFSTFGGIDLRLLPGTAVRVCTSPPRTGVVTCLPPHVLTQDEQGKPFPEDKLRIDLGMTQEQAEALVPVGTPVVYATEPFAMGNMLCGKALDDRACFAMLLRMLQLLQGKPLAVDLCILGSVQEESTMLGAKAGVDSIAPDLAIAVDVTFGRTPDGPTEETFPLGKGPTIGTGPLLARRITARLRECAERSTLPYAMEVLERSTGTNSMAFQIAQEGIPTGLLSVPLRYMHTPLEVVCQSDLEAGAQLLAAFLLSLEEWI